MAQLRRDYSEFAGRNTEILIVGPEKPEAFENYWTKEELPFIGLPDPEHRVLKLYGQEVKLFKFGRLPAQVLIDKTQTVRFVHYGHSMADIPKNGEIFGLIDTELIK